MRRLLDSNPGLARRFPKENIFDFPDFSPEELWNVLVQMLKTSKLEWQPGLETELRTIIQKLYDQRDEFFGNAGEIRNLAEGLERRYAVRMQRDQQSRETPLNSNDIPEKYRNFPG